MGRLYKAAEDFGQDKEVRKRKLPTLPKRKQSLAQGWHNFAVLTERTGIHGAQVECKVTHALN
eukprot:2027337-Prymnesium_polylepis.1